MVAVVQGHQIHHDENWLTDLGPLLSHLKLNGSPHHQLGELFLGDLIRQRLSRNLAVSHHDDSVGDLERLLQLVADEDDALAVLFETLDDPEELLYLLRGQH